MSPKKDLKNLFASHRLDQPHMSRQEYESNAFSISDSSDTEDVSSRQLNQSLEGRF